MRTKILFAVALAMGIASLVLLILSAADQTTITVMLTIGLVCVAIEHFAGKKDEKASDEPSNE